MKNKKFLIVCILAIVIVAIGIAIGVNVSASNKYATAMELIEEYKGDFDSNDELDSKQAVYDSFVGDSTLNSYYGNNDSFDKNYDSTKEYFEGEIKKLEAEIEQAREDEADVQESLETETDDSENTESEDIQASDEENASSDTSSSDTKNENTTSSNENTSNEQQASNNTESTTDGSSNSSSSSIKKLTATGYRPDLGQLITWYAPDVVNQYNAKGYAVEWDYTDMFTINGQYFMDWSVMSGDNCIACYSADENGNIIWDWKTQGEAPLVQN